MKVDWDSYIQSIKSLPHLTLGSYPKKHKQLLNDQMELNHLPFGMIFSNDKLADGQNSTQPLHLKLPL